MSATDASGSVNSSIDTWNSQWQQQALTTPCGSCTGRACTVCSIRTGGSSSANGQPSGYAPKVLEYYNSSSATGDPSGIAGPSLMMTADNAVTAMLRSDTQQETMSADGGASGLANASFAALAAPAQNAIVLENMKQGTPESEWLIGQADSSIEGFSAQFTLDHGQQVDFKINTDAKNYRIDIYRLGYYNGDGARKVATINQNLATAQFQPAPLFDPTTKLVDAGNWSVSASWNVPLDAVSGVYIAELTRLDTGGQNIIPFIVRDDEQPSDITFQTSDTTWQAYNWWGGYNLYGGIETGGRAGRADAVSYNRPIITRDGGFSSGPQDFIFGAEYPTIRWLEQNGYDVNYISGIDTARDGAQLLNSKVFLSVGHDEYWSGDQRANVEAARDAGVNLAFLSGNEVYWETRWATSIDGSGTPYKTMISYKETWDNADSDPGHTTGTWRDPQYGAGQPENALTGTIFTVDSYRLDTITIPYNLSNFRFWSNTAVASIQPGQVYSLTPNLLGYEWDSDLDNGSRPDGLIALSSTTVDVNTLLLDNGNTTGAGTASHSLTLYRAPSGALVFGAGTVYWTWGLDSHHDNEATPTDPNVQQAMVNLFADMGIQPQTLMQSLAVASQTTDSVAPTTTVTPPTNGPYAAAQPITITGTAVDAGGGSVAVVEVSTDGGSTWHRATGFENWSYTFTPLTSGTYNIRSRAVDDSVNMESPSAGINIAVSPSPTASLFSASDTPTVLSETDSFVNLGVKFTTSQSGSIVGLKFYKGLGDGGTHVGTLWSSTGTVLASATFTEETVSGWQTVTFDHPIAVGPGVSYVASYRSSGHYADTVDYFTTAGHTSGPLTAQAGNGLYTYGTDILFPTEVSNYNYWVDVIFSSVVPTNIAPVGNNDNGFTAIKNTQLIIPASVLLANDTDANGDVLSISGIGAASGGTATYDPINNVVTFTPNSNYVGSASFGYAISDGRGGIGSAQVNLSVVPSVSNVSLFSSSDVPSVLAESDPSAVNLGVHFTSSSNGTITGIKYYKSAGDTGTHTGSLWSSTGTLLANATFLNESTSGWQTVTFSNPVTITAGTTYVASFHSNGHYTSTGNYFTTDHISGVLTAQASGNGVYTYGNSNLFPTNTYGETNYWVDVVFSSAGGASVNHAPVANADSGFTTPQGNTLTIAASTLLANDTDSDGDSLIITGAGVGVNGTAGYVLNTNSVTFTPNPGYSGPASFTYAISDGHGGTANATVNLTVQPSTNHPPVAVSDSGLATTVNTALAITASTLLANDTDQDGNTLVVTGANGGINGTAVFNTQTNTVTFTPTAGYTGPASFNYSISDGNGGTASAIVSLNVNAAVNHPPVAVADSGFTTTTNTALAIAASTLLANDTDQDGNTLVVTGANGGINGTAVFNTQTNTVTFTPTAGYTGPASFNYTISDGNGGTSSALVSLNISAPVNHAPTAGNDSGFSVSQNSTLTLPASSLLANDSDSDGDTLTITGIVNGSAVNGVASFNATTNVVTFTPTAGYTGAASFGYSISDGKGGTATATVNLAVATPSSSLFGASDTPAVTSNSDSNQVNLGVKFVASSNGAITGIKYYKGANDTGTHTGSLWSSTGTLLATTTFTNETSSGWQTATFSTPISIVAGTTYVASFHSNGRYTYTSGYFSTAHTSGSLTAPAASNGVFTYGNGNLFPTSTFGSTNYWVDVTFSPGIVAPNQSPTAANDSGFNTNQNAALSISASSLLANDSDPDGDPLTVTGVSGGVHGTATFNAGTNTVTFTPDTGYSGAASFNYAISDGRGGISSASAALTVNPPAPNQSPTAANDSGFNTTQNTVLSISASSLLANDSDPDGDPLTVTGVSGGVHGAAAFNAGTNTVTFTPDTGYTGAASFNYAISDGRGGISSASAALTVNPASTSPIVSLFSASSTPALTSVSDFNSVELGVKFQASANGDVLGIRFYKGAANIGTHVADLWSTNGTLLATATFTNETASGWQQVNFANPVAITSGTTYIASYHTSGNYAADPNFFANTLTNGLLTAPSSASSGGNGVYAYGSNSLFPSNTYNSTSYGVDVLFRAQLAA